MSVLLYYYHMSVKFRTGRTWRRICVVIMVMKSDEYLSALSAPTPLTLPTELPDLHKEMFILGYCTELRALRWLQYLYERDSRVYWNRILYPEVLEETMFYCDTDHIICREIEFHMENKDLELAFYRASGPSVRYKLYTKSLIITLITAI